MPRFGFILFFHCLCLGCGMFPPYPQGDPRHQTSVKNAVPSEDNQVAQSKSRDTEVLDYEAEQTELKRLERELRSELTRIETSVGREQDAWEIAAGAPRRATLKAQIQRQKQRVELARKANERRAAAAPEK